MDFQVLSKYTTDYIDALCVYSPPANAKNSSIKYDHPFIPSYSDFYFDLYKITNKDLSRDTHNPTQEVELQTHAHTHSHHAFFVRTRSWKSLNNNLLSILFSVLSIYYHYYCYCESASYKTTSFIERWRTLEWTRKRKRNNNSWWIATPIHS